MMPSLSLLPPSPPAGAAPMLAPASGAVGATADFGAFVDALGGLPASAEGAAAARVRTSGAVLASPALQATIGGEAAVPAVTSAVVPDAPKMKGEAPPPIVGPPALELPAAIPPAIAALLPSTILPPVAEQPGAVSEASDKEDTASVGEALESLPDVPSLAQPVHEPKVAPDRAVSVTSAPAADRSATVAPTAGSFDSVASAPLLKPKADVQAPADEGVRAAPVLASPPLASLPVAHEPVQVAAALPNTPVAAPRLTLGNAFGEQLGVAIARRVHGGGEEVSIRMEPADLGRIEVRLAFDEGGSLRAVVSAESSMVLDSIRRDMGDLTRALADAGVRTDAQSFRFDRGSGGSGGNAGGSTDSGSGQRGWQGGGDRSGQHHQHREEQYRPARRNGRLDLMA